MINKILLSFILMLASITMPLQLVQATVTSTTNQISYNGDGVSSTFSFPFNVFNSVSENDLVVSKINVSTGVITELAINTDYTVSLIHRIPSNGSITLTAGALAVGTTLLIQRELPLTQNVQISDNSATPASTTNAVYDRQVMIAQQLQGQISLGVLQNPLATSTLTLPLAVSGQCLGWTGSALANLACSGSSGGGGGSAFNPPIADSQLQAITTANKVNGSALYTLTAIPSGAGKVPIANLDVGTTASKMVQLTAAAKYPAVDGSLITNISGANLTSLSATPSGAGIIPIANLASGTPTGSKFIRDDGTLQTVTTASKVEVFTSSGTWTCPTGVNYIKATLQGAGGAGAGGDNTNTYYGGGGGAGAAIISRILKVTPASTYAVTIGSGGVGTTGTSTGQDGGNTSMVTDAGTITANGGKGGESTFAPGTGAGGAGGAGSTSLNASTTTRGGVTPYSYAGGNGGNKSGTADGGAGGGSYMGIGGAYGPADTAGSAGGLGAGGGGAGKSATARAGGSGGTGIIIIEYNVNGTPS